MTMKRTLATAAVLLVVALGATAAAGGDESVVAVGASADGHLSAAVAEDDGVDEGVRDAGEDEREGPDVAITGDALEQASARALEMVQAEFGQNGKVTATEVGDEESLYEVEVTLDDGRQVDVQLDEGFDFVGFD